MTLIAPQPRTVPPLAAPRVFISYRHEDTAAWAAHLGGLLRVDLGIENVFVDPDDRQPGAGTALEGRIQTSDVTLVLIGNEFGGVTGGRNLADDDDWVRREIRLALTAKHDVVPVVFGGASVPSSLPDDIALLEDLPRIDVDRNEFADCYQSILTAVWYHLERRPGRLLLIGDADDGIEQAIADFISSSHEIDWAEPRTRVSAATRGLHVAGVERFAHHWPDVLAIDRERPSQTLASRLCGLAHPEKVVSVKPAIR